MGSPRSRAPKLFCGESLGRKQHSGGIAGLEPVEPLADLAVASDDMALLLASYDGELSRGVDAGRVDPTPDDEPDSWTVTWTDDVTGSEHRRVGLTRVDMLVVLLGNASEYVVRRETY